MPLVVLNLHAADELERLQSEHITAAAIVERVRKLHRTFGIYGGLDPAPDTV